MPDAGLEIVAYTKHHPKQAYHNLEGWVLCGCEGAAPPCSVEDDLISGEAGWLVAGCFWGGHEHTLITPGELAINKRKQYNQVLQGAHGTCQQEVRPAHTGMYRIVTFGSTDMAIHTNSHPCRVPEIQLAKRGSCKVEKGTQK